MTAPIPDSLREVASYIGEDATRLLMLHLPGRTITPSSMPRKLIEIIGPEYTAILVREMGPCRIYIANVRKGARRAIILQLRDKGLTAAEAAEEMALTERRILQVWAESK